MISGLHFGAVAAQYILEGVPGGEGDLFILWKPESKQRKAPEFQYPFQTQNPNDLTVFL